MEMHLLGRLANSPLSPQKCLLPLFEAVVNSMDAIKARGNRDGQIVVTIKRDASQRSLPGVERVYRSLPEIQANDHQS